MLLTQERTEETEKCRTTDSSDLDKSRQFFGGMRKWTCIFLVEQRRTAPTVHQTSALLSGPAWRRRSEDRFSEEVNEMERDGRVSGNDYFANEINAVRYEPAAAAAAAADSARWIQRTKMVMSPPKQLQTSPTRVPTMHRVFSHAERRPAR